MRASVLFAACALFFAALVMTHALPASSHIMLNDNPITISGDDCKELLGEIFDVDLDSVKIYDIFVEQPTENLQWFNFTGVEIQHLEMESCVIGRDIHGYSLEIHGLDVDIGGSFAYVFEPGMPVLDDNGDFVAHVRNSTMYARIDHFGPKENLFRDIDHMIDHYEDKTEEASSEWIADVVTLIPESNLVTTNTDYAWWYNRIAKDHPVEMNTILSLIFNAQTKVWMEDYCNSGDRCHDQDNSLTALLNEYTSDLDVHHDHDLIPTHNIAL